MEKVSVSHCYCEGLLRLDAQLRPYCAHCGGYLIKNKFKAIKSQNATSQEPVSPLASLTALRAKLAKDWRPVEVPPEDLIRRKGVVDLQVKLSSHFKFNNGTLALAIYLTDKFFCNNPTSWERAPLYGAVLLLAAGKLTQLDALVPFLPRLRKHASPAFTEKEYRVAEREVLGYFQFNFNYPTLFSFLHCYLAGGMVFSNERNCIQKFAFVEQEATRLGLEALLSPWASFVHPQRVAQAILLKARQAAGLPGKEALLLYGAEEALLSPELGLLGVLQQNQALRATDTNRPKQQSRKLRRTAGVDQNELPTHQQ